MYPKKNLTLPRSPCRFSQSCTLASPLITSVTSLSTVHSWIIYVLLASHFTWCRSKSGPKTSLCGTPLVSLMQSDRAPLTRILCSLRLRGFSIRRWIALPTPAWKSIFIPTSCERRCRSLLAVQEHTVHPVISVFHASAEHITQGYKIHYAWPLLSKLLLHFSKIMFIL